MKRNLLLLIVLCCTMTMLAQNGKISYQAVVRDSENHLVYDTPLQVTVSLANSETGTAVYSEQHAVTSNANGLISLLIGDGQNKQGHWEDVQWNTAWVTATIRKASDQTFLAEHHLPLSAVPYALYADFADSVNLAVLQDYLDEHHYVTEDELPAVQANADWTETNPDTASYIKNKPDLNDYEKKSELCGDVKECIKDTLKYYTTSDQIDTLLGAYYDTTHTKSVISDTATALRAMMGDAAYNAKITLKKNNVELDSFRLNQQTDKAINIPVPTTVAELSDAGNYVTNTKLNDTLGAYYDTANVKQMLKPYLKANELCDSIVKCDVIKDMRDSLGNAFDTLKYYTTSNEIDTLLGAYYDSTKVKSVISDTADAIRAAIPASQVNADWNATGGPAEILNKPDLSVYATTNALKDSLSRYVGKDKLNDTLDSYYTKNNIDNKLNDYEKKSELCGDVKECIKDTLGKYTTSNQIDTLLRAYYDTTHTKSVISDTATALRAMMGDAAYNAKITLKKNNVELDSFRLNQQTDKAINIPVPTTVAELSDAGNYVTKTKLNDTLGAYYDTANVKQMLKPYLKANELCDSIVKCDVIKDMRDSIRDNAAAIQTNATNIQTNATNIGLNKQAIIDSSAHIRNDIKNGQITIAVNRSTATTETTVTNPTFGVNQGTDQTVTINIPQETTVNNGQLTIVAAGDTTRFTANQATNDTVRLDKFATKDTLKNFVNKLAIRDSVNNIVKDSLAAPNSAINKAIDTIAGNAIHDSLSDYKIKNCTDVEKCMETTLGNYVLKTAVRDSVNNAVTDALKDPTSVINYAVDTIARNNIHDTAMAIRLHIRDSVNVVMLDSLAAANSAINKAIDTIARNNIHDTAMAIRLHIRDSVNVVMLDSLEAANSAINKAIDTIARNNIHDTAMAIRLHIRDSVNVVMLDSLEAANSAINKAIDTIARNNIHDTAMAIRLHIRDSVNVVMLDSLEAANSAINKAIDTIAQNNIHDTAMAIRNSIGNGKITIQKNGATITDGSFYLNQKTDQTINITVPTQTSELTNNSNLAYTTGNTFSGTHDFTATTITVPSNEDAIKRPVPTTTPAPECNNMNAVNVCDLLAVFDSLTKRISDLEDELRALKGATPPTVSVSLSEVHSNSIKATATANGNGATVTSYEFCISENGDMSNPICHTTTTTHNTYTFTGLTGNKTYYVTAKATNLVGSTTSSVASERTPAHAPTASFALDPVSPSGFQVVVSGMNFKENGSGTVQICYKKKDGTCPVDISDYSTCDATLDIAANVTDTTRKFFYVDEAGVDYCVIVKIDNGDSITVLDPLTVATGPAISLDITHTPTLLNLCGGSLDVTFTASPNPTSVDLNDYENFTWTESNSTSNVATITYNTGGSKTVTCTATHKTEGYTITGSTNIEVNSGSAPSFTYCEDNSVVTLKSLSDVSSIAWGDGQTKSSGVQVGDTHPYGSSGTYTITATAANGCIATRTFATSGSTLFPCKVSTPHTAFTGGGFNGAHDGRETVNDTFAVTSVKDYDGNDYPVVQIGSQCWLAENMRCVHSPSTGTYIVNPEHKEGNTVSWNSASKFAQWLMNDSATYAPKHFGLLYNWAAAVDTYNVLAGRPELSQGNYETAFTPNLTSNRRGICPLGWHVPTDTEWSIMEQHVLGEDVSSEINYRGTHAAKLSKGCDWVGDSPNNGKPHDYSYSERNSSGFAGVPAGSTGSNCPSPCSYYFYHADFKYAYFWTASLSGNNAFTRNWGHENTGVRRYPNSVCLAMSVRCVRDAESSSSSVFPHVVTSSVTDITINSATLHGSYSPNGNTINAQGFEWRKTEGGSYMVVSASGETMTYELSNLEDNTNYTYRTYVTTENNGTVYGEERTFTTEIVPPSTLMSITPNPSSGVVVCSGGSNVVKYTASVEDSGSDVSDQYKYSWSIPSGLKYYSNGNTCTVIYTSANTYTVSCTATPLNSSDPIEGVADVMVVSASGTDPVPILRTAEDDGTLSVKVMPSTTDAISFNWGDNDSMYTSWTEPYQYASDGVYIIKAINGNCAATKMIAVGLATIRPCTVTSAHTESTYNPISGGGRGGLETVNGEDKVVKVLDQDGNPYAVVQIGNQCWMRSNLRTTHFSDSTEIDNGSRTSNNLQSPTIAYFFNPTQGKRGSTFDINAYDIALFGLYYNWSAASDVKGICPNGWHLPSNEEWEQMYNSAKSNANSELNLNVSLNDIKVGVLTSGCSWEDNTNNAYNQKWRNYSGFSAVPTGYTDNMFRYNKNGEIRQTYFWSSTSTNDTKAYARRIYPYSSSNIDSISRDKALGYSVRCVRDAE